MYDAIELAKYIVSRCEQANNPISNLQLQKILFYIQKAFLQNNELAFADAIEAWRFGPVVPNVYYYFCGYGAMPITTTYSASVEDRDKNVIDSFVDEKSLLDPWVMVSETHKTNGAWDRVYQNGAGNRQKIPFELIKEAG